MGTLLGCMREGRVLPWDYDDADFAFLAEDTDRFLEAERALLAAGFSRASRWQNNQGTTTEYALRRDGARFEFFTMTRHGDTFQYYLYGKRGGIWQELLCAVPAHGLAEIHFLERVWNKPDDHDAFLSAVYGDWRTPNPGYHYATDEKSVIASYPRLVQP